MKLWRVVRDTPVLLAMSVLDTPSSLVRGNAIVSMRSVSGRTPPAGGNRDDHATRRRITLCPLNDLARLVFSAARSWRVDYGADAHRGGESRWSFSSRSAGQRIAQWRKLGIVSPDW